MSAARDEILARVRQALADVPAAEAAEDVPVPRGYEEHDPAGTVERFLERVADYGAGVRIAAPGEVAAAVGEACRAHGIGRVAVPADLPGRGCRRSSRLSRTRTWASTSSTGSRER